MALVIEDGTGVAGATSYVTLIEARAYATARGLIFPAVDSDLEALLVKAMDYLETLRAEFKGTKVFGFGYRQWPREGVVIDGLELAATAIPEELKNGQIQLAVEFQTVDPMATTFGQVVKREKVDVIETEYAVNYKEGPAPTRMPRVQAILAPLLKATFLEVVRA